MTLTWVDIGVIFAAMVTVSIIAAVIDTWWEQRKQEQRKQDKNKGGKL